MEQNAEEMMCATRRCVVEMPPGRVGRGRFYSPLCLRGDVKPTCWGGVRASCREAADPGGWHGRPRQLRRYRAAPFRGMNLGVQGIRTGIARLRAVSVAALAFEKFLFLQKEMTISLSTTFLLFPFYGIQPDSQ